MIYKIYHWFNRIFKNKRPTPVSTAEIQKHRSELILERAKYVAEHSVKANDIVKKKRIYKKEKAYRKTKAIE